MSEAEPGQEGGITPFAWFAVALVVGAIWALLMGLEYYNTPTFNSAALTSIAGVALAVVAMLLIGWRAPSNS